MKVWPSWNVVWSDLTVAARAEAAATRSVTTQTASLVVGRNRLMEALAKDAFLESSLGEHEAGAHPVDMRRAQRIAKGLQDANIFCSRTRSSRFRARYRKTALTWCRSCTSAPEPVVPAS